MYQKGGNCFEIVILERSRFHLFKKIYNMCLALDIGRQWMRRQSEQYVTMTETTKWTVCHDDWDDKVNSMSQWLRRQTELFITMTMTTNWTVCHYD